MMIAILFSLTSGFSNVGAHYENVPMTRVESVFFNPETISKDEEERLYRDCNAELLSEERKLRRFSVSKFLYKADACIKTVYSSDKASYGASIYYLTD